MSALDSFDEKLDAVFRAAAEKRGYARGMIDGYKLAFTVILRWYEERLEKLIRESGGAEVLPLAEPLAERRERPRGRPAEDDTPHVGEMVRIIIKDGNTFGDRKAVSKQPTKLPKECLGAMKRNVKMLRRRYATSSKRRFEDSII
jgi:hypothetical protein